MVENQSAEASDIIEDIPNLFTLKKEQNYTAIKDRRHLFQTKAINTQRY